MASAKIAFFTSVLAWNRSLGVVVHVSGPMLHEILFFSSVWMLCMSPAKWAPACYYGPCGGSRKGG